MSLQDRIENHQRAAKALRTNGQAIRAEAHERLAAKKAGERVQTFAEMENLPVNSDRLPIPGRLVRWQREGLIRIDADAGLFRLTVKGRAERSGIPQKAVA